ncbi:MAG: type II toxin-antitoxin system RelE/ParE family toxin [Aquirhabdus sp.]
MAQVIWTDSAQHDLSEIAEYIAVNNLPSSMKLIQTILSKVIRLENFPESGRMIPELASLSYREIIVNPCRILYKVEGDNIFILHVMRQERDLRKFLLQNP